MDDARPATTDQTEVEEDDSQVIPPSDRESFYSREGERERVYVCDR